MASKREQVREIDGREGSNGAVGRHSAKKAVAGTYDVLSKGFDLIAKVGGAAGALLTVAAILQVWPFGGGPPDVRIDVAASRVNPPGYDSASDEYVCLVNKDGDVNLLGWVVRDAEQQVNVLPDITLHSNQRIRIHPGEGTATSGDVFGHAGTTWNNEGDTITVLDSDGNQIASATYGQAYETGVADCSNSG